MGCLALAGCVEDENGKDDNIKSNENFYLTIVCEPSADWFDYYDIAATYTDIQGKKIMKMLSKDEGINYKASLPLSDKRLANSFSCRITATARPGITYDEDTRADFTSTTDVKVSVGASESSHSLYYDKAEWIGDFGMKNLQGTKIVKWFEGNNHQEGTFINFEYTR